MGGRREFPIASDIQSNFENQSWKLRTLVWNQVIWLLCRYNCMIYNDLNFLIYKNGNGYWYIIYKNVSENTVKFSITLHWWERTHHIKFANLKRWTIQKLSAYSSLLAEMGKKNVIFNGFAHTIQFSKDKILFLAGKKSNIWSTRFSWFATA